MLITLKTKLKYCTLSDNGNYTIGLTIDQAKDLLESLSLATIEKDTDMVALRTKFFNEEGYMGSDDEVKHKYSRN